MHYRGGCQRKEHSLVPERPFRGVFFHGERSEMLADDNSRATSPPASSMDTWSSSAMSASSSTMRMGARLSKVTVQHLNVPGKCSGPQSFPGIERSTTRPAGFPLCEKWQNLNDDGRPNRNLQA